MIHPEIVPVGDRGAYAVDLIINGERFRVHYFAAHRVDPLRDAREYAAKIGDAIKKDAK